MRKWIVVFLVLLMGASLTPVWAAGAKEQAATEMEPVTIKWWSYPIWWKGITGHETEAQLEALKKEGKPATYVDHMIAEFQKLYPHVEIEYTLLSWAESQKLDVAIVSGTQADIFYCPPAWFGKYYKLGAFQPVDDYLTAADRADFFEVCLEQATVDGKVYWWPWVFGTEGEWIINRAIFKERNAEHLLPQPPERSWTMDQFLEAAKAVTFERADGEKVYGVEMSLAHKRGVMLWYTEAFTYGFGAPIFDKKKGGTDFNNEKAVKAVQFMMDLEEKHGVSVPGAAGNTGDSNAFNEYRVAIRMAGGLSAMSTIKKGLADGTLEPNKMDPYMVLPPHVEGEEPGVKAGIGGWTVSSKEEPQRKWAMEFGRFLTNEQNEEIVSVFMMPTRRSASERVYKDNEEAQWILKYSSEYAKPQSVLPQTMESYDLYMEALQKIFTHETSIQDGLDEYVMKANKLFQE